MTDVTVDASIQETMREILALCPIMPVVTIDHVDQAVPLAQALLAGGARSIEVTLRTDCALAAMERIAEQVPDIMVGAGTVMNIADLDRVRAAGARFAISPGHTDSLVQKACAGDFPYLPAASTVAEVMGLRERGFRYLKLFPAAVAGGVDLLKAIGAPIPDVRFCPTGGVSRENAASYLKLSNVICVGGSWVAPKRIMADRDWNGIESLMREGLEAVG